MTTTVFKTFSTEPIQLNNQHRVVGTVPMTEPERIAYNKYMASYRLEDLTQDEIALAKGVLARTRGMTDVQFALYIAGCIY